MCSRETRRPLHPRGVCVQLGTALLRTGARLGVREGARTQARLLLLQQTGLVSCHVAQLGRASAPSGHTEPRHQRERLPGGRQAWCWGCGCPAGAPAPQSSPSRVAAARRPEPGSAQPLPPRLRQAASALGQGSLTPRTDACRQRWWQWEGTAPDLHGPWLSKSQALAQPLGKRRSIKP